MPTRIQDFELVLNDGTPTVPEWLSDLPNKVRFSESGCSSDRFVILNLEQPLDSQRWGGKGYSGPIFDELEFWLDGEDEPTFLMLLLAPEAELSEVVVGAIAGRYVGPQKILQTYFNAESDVVPAIETIRTGLRAQGFLVDTAPPRVAPITVIPDELDFRP